ncbi:MAG: hypothetical protein ACOCVG_01120 [Verrucomicrobiota bacterium]
MSSDLQTIQASIVTALSTAMPTVEVRAWEADAIERELLESLLPIIVWVGDLQPRETRRAAPVAVVTKATLEVMLHRAPLMDATDTPVTHLAEDVLEAIEGKEFTCPNGFAVMELNGSRGWDYQPGGVRESLALRFDAVGEIAL